MKTKVTPGQIIAYIVIGIIWFLWMKALITSDTTPQSRSEANDPAIRALGVESGQLGAAIEEGKRNPSWSQVQDLKARETAFERHANDVLIKHGHTPIPQP